MRVFIVAVALGALALFAACDSGVGGPCLDNFDCPDECLRGPELPGGFCSTSCESDVDCPSDTRCVSERGGVCLLSCATTEECVESLGEPTWLCRSMDAFGDGQVNVCFGDD